MSAHRAAPGSVESSQADVSQGPGLLDAMNAERALLGDLRAALGRQRDAVSHDDLDAIERSVHDVHRVLLTLAQASRKRRALLALATDSAGTSLQDLDSCTGEEGPQLRRARGSLVETARQVATELQVTRAILQGALDNGDRVVRGLLNGEQPTAGYPNRSANEASGVLLNRRV